MKKIFTLLLFPLIGNFAIGQTIENANLHVSNISSNIWFEKYDDTKRIIYNVNFMALCEGNDSKKKTEPFVIKLYLYNKEIYEAEKKVFYIKTYEVPGISHFGSWEVKGGTVNFYDVDVPPGVYRLGFQIDPENVIPEDKKDNAILFEGELVVKEKVTGQGGGGTNTTTTNTTTEKPIDTNQEFKDQKTEAENSIAETTKKITTLEYEIKNNNLNPVDKKIKELEIKELESKREMHKISLEKANKNLDKSISPNDVEKFAKMEQEHALNAQKFEKERKELIQIKSDNDKLKNQVNNYPSQISSAKNELASHPRNNKIDSINYTIKEFQIQEMENRFEGDKIAFERTSKQLENKTSNGAVIYSDSDINNLKSKEDDYYQKANSANSKVQENLKLKKEAEKEAKKAANKEKMDNTKVKVKIKSLTTSINQKQNVLAKERKKKKPNTEKIQTLEKEIEDLEKEKKELESQLN